jgi:hypothetical protein
MRQARIAIAVGLALIAIAAAIVLSHSPRVLARSNGVEPFSSRLRTVPGSGSGCQSEETLPAHITAIALSLEATAGPRVSIVVLAGATIVTRGASDAGWLGQAVTVPVTALDHAVRHATVCFAFDGADEQVSLLGLPVPGMAPASSGGRALSGRMAIEYLRPGSSSWWSLAPSIARRIGLGRAWPGTWVVYLLACLLLACVALGAWLVQRESP